MSVTVITEENSEDVNAIPTIDTAIAIDIGKSLANQETISEEIAEVKETTSTIEDELAALKAMVSSVMTTQEKQQTEINNLAVLLIEEDEEEIEEDENALEVEEVIETSTIEESPIPTTPDTTWQKIKRMIF